MSNVLLNVFDFVKEGPGFFMQYGFYSYENVIYELERLGLFDFILPFLLVFGVVFGVLSHTKIFGNQKGVHVLISFVIGLLAVRFTDYTDFLAIISPKLAIGVTILLFLIVLIGMFVPKAGRGIMGWILVAVGFLIFIIILANTYSYFNSYGYGGGFLGDQVFGWVIMIVLLIGIIVAVAATGGEKSKVKESWKHTIGSLFGDDD